VSRGTLYVVATPLGNLADLSQRAKDTLCSVDLVAAEDTRRSRTLLSHVGARAPLVSVHAHASPAHAARVLRALAEGVCEAGALVVPLPGPSAVVTALSVSGLPADHYTFAGFLPRAGAARRALLARIAASEWTVVVFEAANRTVGLLEDLAAVLGSDRRAAVARELTKVHEECRTGTLLELAGYYRTSPPRGEVTVVVAGGVGRPGGSDPDALRRRAQRLLAEGVSPRDVAGQLAGEFGIPRNQAYRIAVGLGREE
jgi:16S rRNA (cytidine1402-2'-O)-methyltransferase